MASIHEIIIKNNAYTVAIPLVTSNSSAEAITKTATYEGVSLDVGTQIKLKLINGNTIEAPQLNINNLGDIPITGNAALSPKYFAEPNSLLTLIYTGTAWEIIG